MKAYVIGIGGIKEGKSKAGKDYKFTPLYCAHASMDVEGQKTIEVIVDHTKGFELPPLVVGDRVDLDFDSKGFLIDVEVIEPIDKTPVAK